MSDKLFDDFIRQKVNDHAAAVPGNMWNRIQSAKDKRRVIAWWKTPVGALLIGALLLGGGGAIYMGIQNEAPLKNVSDSQNQTNSSIIQKSLQENKGTDLSETIGKSNQPIHDNNLASPLNNNGGNTINETLKNYQEATSQNVQNRKPNVGKLQNPVAENYRTNNNRNQSSGLSNLSLNRQNAVGASISAENEILRLQDFNRAFESSLSQVAITKKNVLQRKLNENLLKNQKFFGFTECPSAYGNARNDWYLEAYVSPDYAFKSTDKGNLPESYFAKKDSTEHFQSAFSAGLRISKSLGENLMIKSGLQYSQINEKFSLRTENERRLITVVTIRTIIRSPGDTLVVSDTSMVEQIGYRVKTTHNKYRSLDVPLILGYEWGNEKWKGSINAGVILNIRSWQQGEMLDTSYTAVSFSKSSAQTFKQNIGLGLYAGFSIIKPVADRIEIFAEPYFRYNISNMTQSKSLFNQRFHSAGINLGIRYKLNGSGQH